MIKKFLCAAMLIIFISMSLFSQENTELASNRISASIGIVSADLSYERVFSPNFSVIGAVSYNNLLIADSFSITGNARFYPFGGGVFFLEAGLGYSFGYNALESVSNAFIDILLFIITLGLLNTGTEYNIFYEQGLAVKGGLGWNFDIGKKDGFRLPLSIGVDARISEHPIVLPYFKLGLGYAF